MSSNECPHEACTGWMAQHRRAEAAEQEAVTLRERVAELTEALQKIHDLNPDNGGFPIRVLGVVLAALKGGFLELSELRSRINEALVEAGYGDTGIGTIRVILSAIREVVAERPELLEELGLEQVGYRTRDLKWINGGLVDGRVLPDDDPVFRVKPDAAR